MTVDSGERARSRRIVEHVERIVERWRETVDWNDVERAVERYLAGDDAVELPRSGTADANANHTGIHQRHAADELQRAGPRRFAQRPVVDEGRRAAAARVDVQIALRLPHPVARVHHRRIALDVNRPARPR